MNNSSMVWNVSEQLLAELQLSAAVHIPSIL